MTDASGQVLRDAPPVPGQTKIGPRGATIVAIVLIAIGCLLRLYFYVDRRSLWLDEVWLALNIVTRSFLGLTQPLDFEQSAPVAFLWTERLAVSLGGVNELALRAFPLLAGCLLLVLLWKLARRLLGISGALFSMTFAVASPLLIYYSSEVKPYIVDALASVVVIWLTLDVLESPDSKRAWVRLAVGGALALLFSTPSVALLAASGVALVAQPAIRGSRAGWTRMVGTGSLWVLLFAIGYFALYRSTANSEYMQRIWSNAFLPTSPGRLVSEGLDAMRSFVNEAVLSPDESLSVRKAHTVVLLLASIGIVWLALKRSLSMALLLFVPIVALGVASMARLWPIVPRLLLFLIPIVVLLMGAGVWAVASFLPARVRAVALTVVTAYLLIPPVRHGAKTIATPNRRDDVAPLIKDFSAARPYEKNDVVMYVLGHAVVPWVYYTARWDEGGGPAFRYAMTRANTAAHFAKRACIRQEPRLRTVFSGMSPGSDSSVAADAAWLAAQPEREVWVVSISYEHRLMHRLDDQLIAHGATRTAERSRNGADIHRYEFPADSSRVLAACES